MLACMNYENIFCHKSPYNISNKPSAVFYHIQHWCSATWRFSLPTRVILIKIKLIIYKCSIIKAHILLSTWHKKLIQYSLQRHQDLLVYAKEFILEHHRLQVDENIGKSLILIHRPNTASSHVSRGVNVVSELLASGLHNRKFFQDVQHKVYESMKHCNLTSARKFCQF